jgi:hypothetical protein
VSVPWLEARLARIKGSSASRKDGGEQVQRRAVEQCTAAPAPPQMDVRIATQVLTAGMEQGHRADLDAEIFLGPDPGGPSLCSGGRGCRQNEDHIGRSGVLLPRRLSLATAIRSNRNSSPRAGQVTSAGSFNSSCLPTVSLFERRYGGLLGATRQHHDTDQAGREGGGLFKRRSTSSSCSRVR